MSSSTMLLLRLRPIVSESSGRSSFWPTTCGGADSYPLEEYPFDGGAEA